MRLAWTYTVSGGLRAGREVLLTGLEKFYETRCRHGGSVVVVEETLAVTPMLTEAVPANGLGPKRLAAPERCLQLSVLVSYLDWLSRALKRGAAPE